MKELPYMRLYIGDFLKDTIHLSASETGAYIMLIMSMFNSRSVTLPDDDKRLARMARCTPAQWKKIRPSIADYFDIKNGEWSQKRVKIERLAVEKISTAQSTRRNAKSLKTKEPDPTPVKPGKNRGLTISEGIVHSSVSKNKTIQKGFDDFYDAYAFKKSRGQAEKAWGKVPVEDHALIIEAAKKAASIGGSYRQHPATWLNAKGWLDEHKAPQGRKLAESPDDYAGETGISKGW